MKLKNILNIKSLILPLLSVMVLTACVDEKLDFSVSSYNPAEDPEMVCLPFNLFYDYNTVTTRDGESDGTEDDPETDEPLYPGFVDGSDKEHTIDFDTDKECFAIFFGPDPDDNNKVKFKYMKRLYTSDQLGTGKKEPGSYTEFSVPVVCYIPKSDCKAVYAEDDTAKENPLYYEPNLINVLVVLNGGPIYDTLHEKLYVKNSDGTDKAKDLTINDVLAFTWDNPADYGSYPYNKDKTGSVGEIGKNKKGNFTMTSSAYWKKTGETYDLQTAALITGKAYDSIKKYVESGDEPTSTIYVERMLAKFSAPTFETAVIGSQRVFRPDQNAMTLVVYSWDGNYNPVSEEKNWRIHLIGWAINGTESSSYLFKNVGNVGLGQIENIPAHIIENDKYIDWNKEGQHRSFWGVDPHYKSGVGDFYPWQFRKASDRSDIISVQAGLASEGGEYKEPALRYKTFRDLLEVTDWQPIRYVHENTYDPDGDWYRRFDDDLTNLPDDERASNPYYLDGRTSLLAGPHLIIGGELYLEGEGSDYVSSGSSFGRVADIYSDRLRRFYRSEVDWFKMFFYELNNTLEAQEVMSFSLYDWDQTSPDKLNERYTVELEGKPRLFFDGQELTFEMIDELAKDPYVSFSETANVRNGDGRMVPWLKKEKHLPGGQTETVTLEIRLTQDGKDRTDASGRALPRKKAGDRLYYTEEGSSTLKDTWTRDMYESFFYEWFGPIDHYFKGYMYYAGDITHNKVLNNTNFYGTVRNHWYKFFVKSINSLGVPVDNPDQLLIPGNYNYNDQIIVFMDVIGWHTRPVTVDIP